MLFTLIPVMLSELRRVEQIKINSSGRGMSLTEFMDSLSIPSQKVDALLLIRITVFLHTNCLPAY